MGLMFHSPASAKTPSINLGEYQAFASHCRWTNKLIWHFSQNVHFLDTVEKNQRSAIDDDNLILHG